MSDSVIRARTGSCQKAESASDERALPFPVKAPNAETEAALRDAQAGRGIKRHASVEALFTDLSE